MEIPGIAPFSGQPTVTNPLSSEARLVGNTTQAQNDSETQNTVTVSEQESTAISNTDVVEQTNETSGTGLNTDTLNPGGNIDITA